MSVSVRVGMLGCSRRAVLAAGLVQVFAGYGLADRVLADSRRETQLQFEAADVTLHNLDDPRSTVSRVDRRPVAFAGLMAGTPIR